MTSFPAGKLLPVARIWILTGVALFLTIIGFGWGLTKTEVHPRETQILPVDSQLLLPETSRHQFVPVDPAWRQSIQFFRPFSDSFMGVDNPTSDEKQNLYKEVRFFAGPTDQPNDAVKILTYYPDGKLYRHIDKSGDEQFTQGFFADGSFSDFTHWRQRKWIAGVAVNRATGKASYFAEGNGSLTTFSKHENDVHTTSWYQHGDIFLIVKYERSRRTEFRLCVGDDMLIKSKTEERLWLRAEHEHWTRPVGGPPWVQIMGAQLNDDIPTARHPSRVEVIEEIRAKETQMLVKAWTEKRRPGFIKRYTELLATTGQSWESLKIEFIRDDSEWPQR